MQNNKYKFSVVIFVEYPQGDIKHYKIQLHDIPTINTIIRINQFTYCKIKNCAVNSDNYGAADKTIDVFCLAEATKLGQLDKLIYEYYKNPINELV